MRDAQKGHDLASPAKRRPQEETKQGQEQK